MGNPLRVRPFHGPPRHNGAAILYKKNCGEPRGSRANENSPRAGSSSTFQEVRTRFSPLLRSDPNLIPDWHTSFFFSRENRDIAVACDLENAIVVLERGVSVGNPNDEISKHSNVKKSNLHTKLFSIHSQVKVLSIFVILSHVFQLTVPCKATTSSIGNIGTSIPGTVAALQALLFALLQAQICIQYGVSSIRNPQARNVNESLPVTLPTRVHPLLLFHTIGVPLVRFACKSRQARAHHLDVIGVAQGRSTTACILVAPVLWRLPKLHPFLVVGSILQPNRSLHSPSLAQHKSCEN
ncbi:hypothetical protein RJ640_017539 [Escallonia rubra]|uniref:Uncharacterized protein n=1 Tax=Escallonia rubra TaxID=112253 RepID=A0AA88UC85_9ASTE|nr:hypothetical protein RJ640_017539 [Escallonia rubra]